MVTVVKNPTGYHIIDQAVTADVTDSSGDALITFPYHSLGTGDFIYIDSDIDEYNGFWYVTAIDANSFKISEYDGADFVAYEQDLEIEYYQTNPHVWSSIYLPIVYKISNDLWPVNTADTARTISSFSDDNGYTDVVLSGAIRGLVNQLEFVKITGASNEDLNGVWQIVEVISTSNLVISLPYDAANNFSGASIQYYYNNYQVKVKVYGGLDPTHPWEHKKPYQEVAELSLTPDDNNIVMFSVADYIKGKVAVKNNPTIGSYPLNLDAFTGFYISTAESYDQSDNYGLYTEESTFFDDTFEGYAITGKLPFKNRYSGSYSDYVLTSGSQALWLTNFSRLFAIEGLYFDISFIKNVTGDFQIIIDKYVADYLATTETIDYADRGIGVYRIPIEVSSVYDSYCVRAIREPGSEEVEVPPDPIDLTLLTNEAASGDLPDWTLGAEPFILGQSQSDNLSYAIALPNVPININYRFRIENKGPGFASVQFETLDAGLSSLNQVSVTGVDSNGIYEGTISITPNVGTAYLTVTFNNFGIWDMYLEYLSLGDPTFEEVPYPEVTLTEEICIDILVACAAIESGDTPDEDFFRLLETGFFRLLEDGERRLLEDAP